MRSRSSIHPQHETNRSCRRLHRSRFGLLATITTISTTASASSSLAALSTIARAARHATAAFVPSSNQGNAHLERQPRHGDGSRRRRSSSSTNHNNDSKLDMITACHSPTLVPPSSSSLLTANRRSFGFGYGIHKDNRKFTRRYFASNGTHNDDDELESDTNSDDTSGSNGSGNEDLTIGSETELQDRIDRLSKLSPREVILSKADKTTEDTKIINEVLDWIENVVIGLNLCPFAEKPFLSKTLHVEVIGSTPKIPTSSSKNMKKNSKKGKTTKEDPDAISSLPAPVTDDMIEEILSYVLAECFLRRGYVDDDEVIDGDNSMVGHTSLLVCPQLYPDDFEKYLEVYNMLQDGVLVEHGLTDDIQIAPFHPLFEFDGSGAAGVDNYTNRSPYPIFHILREQDVSNAVDVLDGDASIVWKRNVQLLEALEAEFGTGSSSSNDSGSTTSLGDIIRGKQLDDSDQQKVRDICREVTRQARKEAKEARQQQEEE